MVKFGVSYFGVLLVVLPSWVLAQSADFDALLAQVSAPPKTVAQAAARWQQGNENVSPAVPYDKNAVSLRVKLDALQKNLLAHQETMGGQSAADIQQKMAGMTQQEKMDFAMQMVKKMQQDQQSAYTGANAQSLARVQQTDGAQATTRASMTAAQEMDEADNDFKPQVEALTKQLAASVMACPEHTLPGGMNARNKDCAQPLLDKYKADYDALAEKHMAKINAIYLKEKMAAKTEIKGWEEEIAALKADGSETANNSIVQKKAFIYGEIEALTLPAGAAVTVGYDASQVNPKNDCGPDCDLLSN
jgi:hypothetical protein